MPDLESQIRLALELTGARTAGEAADEIERLGKEAGRTKAEIEEATRVFRYYEEILKGATAAEDEAVQKAIELTEAQRAVRQAVEETNRVVSASSTATVAAAGTDSGGGFAGLSRSMFAAEKAATALAGGHSLGRLGPMLETVTLSLGGPAGMGFALGGLAFALEGMLPKIEAWIDKWDKGEKKLDAVKQALAGLDQATELTDRERALKRTSRQIAKLEAKEDEQGYLSEVDKEDLQQLEAAAFNARRRIAEEKMVASTGQSKKDKARGAAVKEALAETGGGGAGAAKMLADRDNISIDEAYTIVAGAMEGSGNDIARLKEHVPKFAEQFAITDPETKLAKEAAKEKERQRKQKAAETAHGAEQRFAEEQRIEREQKAAEDKQRRETAHGAEQRFAEEQRIEREQKAADTKAAREAAREAEHARKQAEHARKQAEHAAEKFAREHTPLALNRAAMQQQENEDLGMMQNYAPNLEPELQKSAAKHARANHQAGKDLSATFQQALDYAIEQARQDFARGIEAGMRHSMGHRPTLFGRGQG